MSVTIEQHREMVEKGISIRKDDKFGFKKKCGNISCSEFVETCYCTDSLEEAIKEVDKRSERYHNLDCALEHDEYFSKHTWELISEYSSNKFYTPLQQRLQTIVLDTLNIKIKDLVSYGEKALPNGKWMLTIKDKDYVLYSLLKDELRDEMDNWDHEPEDTECSCEL